MNFLMNSGSYFLITIVIICFFILRETLARCMIPCRKSKLARMIGIASHVDNVRILTLKAVIKLFIENYLELCLALAIGLCAFTNFPIAEFWQTRDDRICTCITILYALIAITAPLVGLRYILKNFEEIKYHNSRSCLTAFLEDVDVRTK
jgi:hypothetical protein